MTPAKPKGAAAEEPQLASPDASSAFKAMVEFHKGANLHEVGRKSGVIPQTVNNWLSGKVPSNPQQGFIAFCENLGFDGEEIAKGNLVPLSEQAKLHVALNDLDKEEASVILALVSKFIAKQDGS